MGEWQKALGDKGENIVASFMEMIGWSSGGKSDIPCSNNKHFGEGGNPRKTHGIDGLFSYRSPLCDGLCDMIAISVKYKESDVYPTSQSKFKGFYDELAECINCYQRSEEYKKQRDQFPDCTQVRNFGVLFWFTGSDPYAEHKRIALKSDIIGNDGLHKYDGIYLVDNRSASFIWETVARVRHAHPKAKISYSYFDTGKCTDPRNKEFSGDLLPIEYLGSGMLPLKVSEVDRGNTLYLSSAAEYSEDELARLIGLALSMSQDWPNKIRLLFPDFDALRHEASAVRVLNGFMSQSAVKKVEFGSVKQSFLQDGQ